jgi:ketosteroid isomerase-like protein
MTASAHPLPPTAAVPDATLTAATRERVRDLVAHAERWSILEAMDEFYAEDVVMQENLAPPTVGLAANRERERAFVQYVAEVREMRAAAVLVDGNRAVINWHQELVGTDGKRLRFDQLAYQLWENGKIVFERFVYDPASLAG